MPGISASRWGATGRSAAPRRGTAPIRPRVVGVAGRAERGRGRGLLDLAAGIHHHHPVGDLRHHAEIVGDQHDGGADAPLEVAHQVEDLGLDRHVEGRCRLVGDQQFGRAGERDGDHHPLAHAAGELVRVFPDAPPRLGDADQRQHLHRPLLRVLARQTLMQPQGLADLAPDGQHRVERGHRLLEDHADGVAADAAHLALGQAEEVAALEPDRAGEPRRRLGQSRRIDIEVTDLPQPDSPTIASVSPARIAKETPSTARLTPSGVRKWTWRFSTERSVMGVVSGVMWRCVIALSDPRPHPEVSVDRRSTDLEGGLQISRRLLEPSFEAQRSSIARTSG